MSRFAYLAATLALAACSGTGMGNTGGEGGLGSIHGNAGNGGSAGWNGFDFGGNGGDGGGTGFEACATSSEEATLIPVTMFITVDKSGSMGDNSKWTNAKAAFVAFFQDAGAQNLNVALRFWPEDACDGTSCNVDVCATPNVDVGSLSDPNHVSNLIQAFENRSPGGNTPMSAALDGATKWAMEHQGQVENGERTVVVMLTDGEPNGCDENVANISAFAQNAWNAEEIPTFAVGLEGSNEATMDSIAMAGGTDQGFFIGNGNAQADLLAALLEIQKNTLACVYAMPEPTGSDPIDPTLVNVVYTPSDGSPGEPLGQVANEAACGGDGGWFYDDPQNPAIISLCPNTCAAVQSDVGAKIQVLLGCATLAK